MENLGKLRKEHQSLFKEIVEHFKEYNLKAGIHGTSLWNRKYKDVDLLLFSEDNNAASFLQAFETLKSKYPYKILHEKGTPQAGLDYEIEIEGLILHLSFAITL